MPPTTDTRQRLIDAACELFWERGYAATGLSDILEAAGARGGSLYHFFPTKDDLLLAVIERHTRVIEATIENTLAAKDEPIDKALAAVEFYRGFMHRTTCTLGCPLTNLAGEIADSHPKAGAAIAAFNDRLVERLAEPIALSRGVSVDPAARSLARTILCMVQGATLQSRASKSEAPLDACADAVRTVLGAPAPSPVVVPREVRFARA